MAAISTLRYIGNFLFSHSNLRNPKYGKPFHPLLCFIVSSIAYLYGSIKMGENCSD